MEAFRNLLTQERRNRNLSLRAAAEHIGISHSYLAALEKGMDSRGLPAVKPTPDTLRLIGRAYGLDYNRLLELCGYASFTDSFTFSNPDTRKVARAAQHLNAEQAAQLRKYVEFMFPHAADKDM